MDADVIVIGAGVAGLQAARRLQGGGLDVLVVDGADGLGGRIRTDLVDGFRCDRGFQLLNPAYPMARQALDLHALRLQSFGSGVLVRRDDARSGLVLVADPRRAPLRALATMRSGLVHPREAARLAAWVAPVLARPESIKDPATDSRCGSPWTRRAWTVTSAAGSSTPSWPEWWPRPRAARRRSWPSC